MRSIKTILTSLAAAALLAGCAAGASSSQPAVASTQGLTCDGCKVTFVNVPVGGGKNSVVGYRQQARMTCPACKDEVESFFSTGKFQHECKVCGGNMSVCEAHPN